MLLLSPDRFTSLPEDCLLVVEPDLAVCLVFEVPDVETSLVRVVRLVWLTEVPEAPLLAPVLTVPEGPPPADRVL